MKKGTGKLILYSAVATLALFMVAAAAAPRISGYSPYEQNLKERFSPPSRNHILGTDEFGRDVFSRLIHAGRVSLSVAAVAVVISVVIGAVLGLFAGYFGGWTDSVIVKLIDIFLCMPTFFLILMVVAFWGPSVRNIMIVIGVTSWPGLARLVRAEVLSVSKRDYICSGADFCRGCSRIGGSYPCGIGYFFSRPRRAAAFCIMGKHALFRQNIHGHRLVAFFLAGHGNFHQCSFLQSRRRTS